MNLSGLARFRLLLPLLLAAAAHAQAPVGTGFTYQGRLLQDSLPANGPYDLRFTLHDALSGGNVVAGPVTVGAVPVAQGLFTVPLDFGSAAFQGQARFLEIEVQPTGGGPFTLLTPRQELRPSPYTVFSSYTDPANLTILDASNLTSGTVPDPRLSGTYSQALALTNPANAVSGTFSGDGFALTNLNASNLTSGTVPDPRLAGTYSSPLAFPNSTNVLAGDGLALTNLSADNLASGTVPGARISGTYPNPVTFPSTGNFFTGDGSGLFNLNAQPKYVRTVVVSPVGTPAENGTALLAALAGITTASAANPWLLKIEPGIYDVGATSFVMKPFVDVEGSGEAVTKITGVGNASNTVGTVQVVADTELRFVTVENTGGATYAKPIFVDSASPRISHVTALGSGATGTGESQGVFVLGAASPVISNVTARATATGSARSYAMLDVGSSSLQLNVSASTDGGDFSQAVWICCGASPTLRNVFSTATGAVSGNLGVVIHDSSPRLENVVGVASGAATNNTGVYSADATSSPTLLKVTGRASGATGQNIGIATYSGSQATLEDALGEGSGGTFAAGVLSSSAGVGHSLSRVHALASGASSLTAGVFNDSCSPRITDLEAVANGTGAGNVYGVEIASGSPSLSHVTATAGGSTSGIAVGIAIFTSGPATAPSIADAVATASGSSNATFGVWNHISTTPTFTDARISVVGGGGSSYAVLNTEQSQVSMTGVTATVSAPGGLIAGIYNNTAAVQLTEVSATATGASATIHGLFNDVGASTVTVNRSTLNGVTNSVLNTQNSGIRIGGSQLVGPVTTMAGSSTTCVLSYNGGYAPVNALCQ